jgi:uncharacterized protein (DUF433 family)
MSKGMKIQLWDLIERLEVLADWEHDEYVSRFGITKSQKSKQIKEQLKDLLEIPNGNWK